MSDQRSGHPGDLHAALRALPSVTSIITTPEVTVAAAGLRPEIVVEIVQQIIEGSRRDVLGGNVTVDPTDVSARVVHALNKLRQPRLHQVINGTGVIVHTNLGRAPVSQATEHAMAEAAGHYTPLELDLHSGRRGRRMSEISRLVQLLTGAEATLVVNNNAAAILLTLSALCAGQEVILSRSQAVEIGGGFRVPDVMVQGGARLVEVGTTNRTYARDYETAITDQTAAFLSVHWSNFRIIGFTAQPDLAELTTLAHARGLLLLEDLGSGSLLDTSPYGLQAEPTVGQSIAAGVDVVCFSGDKLLGGPQAGIISGKAELVRRISAHPLARAVRADKTALAGVAQTLRHYLSDDAAETIPVWRMISADAESLRQRCQRWGALLEARGVAGVTVEGCNATVGGGSLPGETLPSWAISLQARELERYGLTLERAARRLRTGQPSLMARLDNDRLLIDSRTVLPDEDDGVVEALTNALTGK